MIQQDFEKIKFLRSDVLSRSEDKKLLNKKFYKLIENENIISMTDKTKTRIFTCGTFLEFYTDKGLENIKLFNGNFCGNRFCPICSANKSRKDSYKLKLMVDYLKSDYSFIFLTLTVKNCSGFMLNKTIKHMNDSFKRFSQTKSFKNSFKGYVRKLEVTYNPVRDDFHPHFHVLIAVNKSYFTDTRIYLSRDKILKLWQKSLRDFDVTQVDVRKFRDDDSKSIFELTKYFSKDSNYLYDIDIFKIFYSSLKRKQLITYNGVFSDASNKFEIGDLDYLKELVDIDFFYKIYSRWLNKGYNFEKIIELSESDKEVLLQNILD